VQQAAGSLLENDPMHSADAQRLAETMSALAVNLAAEHNQQATLNAIVAAAVTTVPGAKWAGISLIAGRDITARHPLPTSWLISTRCNAISMRAHV
jgi:hypothetical protein